MEHSGDSAEQDTVDIENAEDAEDLDFDDWDPREAFGLPDELPPLRLPPEPELADLARECQVLDAAAKLAGRITSGEQTEPRTHEENHLLDIAEGAGFLEPEADRVDWPPAEDSDVLDVWAVGLAATLGSLAADAHRAGETTLAFEAVGIVAVELFLVRGEGIPDSEASELVRDAVLSTSEDVAEQDTDLDVESVWEAWIEAHGDPWKVLVERMTELGAADVDDEGVVRLTALGLYAMWLQFAETGVDIPLLPPAEEMTAADLVAAADGFTEAELAEETAIWLGARDGVDAARDLLAVAAIADPADRIFATSVASGIGADAEQAWRAVLDQPPLRPYAHMALHQLGQHDLADQPEVELELDDLAWLLTDLLAATADELGPEQLAGQLSETVPSGHEQELFEVMWRLPHPSAHDVLSLLGDGHPDKAIAKAARKAAFKASSS